MYGEHSLNAALLLLFPSRASNSHLLLSLIISTREKQSKIANFLQLIFFKAQNG